MYEPDILTLQSGIKVTDKFLWQERRKEILGILAEEEYGFMPPVCGKTEGRTESRSIISSCGAVCEKILITVPCEKGSFSFPLKFVRPADSCSSPLFLFINFSGSLSDKYLPLDMIINRGFALALVYYEDIIKDNCPDMDKGIGGYFSRPGNGSGYGKISLWAYALSRALDYLLTRDDFDKDEIACIGHSRLGKTALLCGAADDRIKYVISNCSGCGGAAYERIKHGRNETISHMNVNFPYWFCENRMKYGDCIDAAPFDQHFLIGACAGRHVLVNSAMEDEWADPEGERLSCLGAEPAFEIAGGRITYFRRKGVHALTAEDWKKYTDYIGKER